MTNWTLDELARWDDRIQEKVQEFGLDCYPQEFEVCDQTAMLGYMAYHGMPSHYPHWSFGKSFEKTKTMYDHGVSGLPYEMVINSDPCLAYLMRDNSLCLQILTIAHVYGHNDFFKKNFNFAAGTRADETVAMFKARADRVRRYQEDPSISALVVEEWLDSCHALSFSRSKNPSVPRLSHTDQVRRAIEAASPPEDPFPLLARRTEAPPPDLSRVPLEPDEDLLLFIRDHRRDLADWQRDILTIVDDEARYFIPQIETKIMNEGWASFWHHKIMNSLGLPQDIHLEFLVRHNQVVCPHPRSINPYHLGFVLWHRIEEKFGGADTPEGRRKMFEVRESDRDTSFLRRFLDAETMREIDMFSYAQRGEHYVVDEVAEEGWEDIKAKLIRQTGTASMPTIKIHDADYGGARGLYLVHEHEGRDLEVTHAEKTLGHLRHLWGGKVWLRCILRGKPTLLCSGPDGFDAKLIN
jgi:stage V sporulation protein R